MRVVASYSFFIGFLTFQLLLEEKKEMDRIEVTFCPLINLVLEIPRQIWYVQLEWHEF